MKIIRSIFFIILLICCENSTSSVSYYFDSLNGSDLNDGIIINNPFKSLKKLETIVLSKGDRIFLSNGSNFKGNIKIMGLNDISISNYNSHLNNNSPIIDSKGHIAGIYIEDSSNISISNLFITANGGGVVEQYPNLKTSRSVDRSIMRSGILVNVSSDNTFKNISVDRVVIKDLFFEDEGFIRDPSEVRTSMGKQAYGFGIRFYNSSEYGTIDGIKVSNCFVENIGHTGIKMTSNGSENKFKNIEVANNKLLRTGGPSIQFSLVEDLHVYGNDVKYSGSPDDGRKWGRGSGLWTWGSSNVIIEKNSFMYANGPADSAGCHIDFNCDNVIVQYNLSVENAGGFIEILGDNFNCSYRYNISINDGHRIKGKNNAFQEGKTFWLSGYVGKNKKRSGPFNSYIYNNTIFTKKSLLSKIAVDKATNGVLVANNIFHIEGDSEFALGDQYRPDKGGGEGNIKNVFFENNLFLNDSYWPKNVLIQPKNSFFGNSQFSNKGGQNIRDYIPKNINLIKNKGIKILNISNDTIGLFKGLELEFDILGNKITDLPDLGAIEVN